ncbi:GNAT family N-acetyltransferase [Paenibacillus sp. N1-5-1-14]|uniref:GNAT family N-acetyltransferase n=1 Tax=Paenibacillus radicibacter TaxID=2972488 RepID=UPI0021595D45|nr:GNAT family N-acetyltransferase [Paenibacillus radicibacter]MCR8641107.1 GNAT family N-acetyltransferase [Paenibacillus radicibacter]
MSEMNYETNRLRLRRFELEDAGQVQALAGDVEIARTTLFIPHPYPDGVAETWIESTHQNIEAGTSYAFAMIHKETNLLIGAMTIGVTRHHDRGELAYWIGKPYWNQGYGTEAAARVMQYGFEQLGLNRVWAAAMTKNPGSSNIMKKIGMQYEGLFKEHVNKWDVYEDLVFYGLSKRDYEKMMEK